MSSEFRRQPRPVTALRKSNPAPMRPTQSFASVRSHNRRKHASPHGRSAVGNACEVSNSDTAHQYENQDSSRRTSPSHPAGTLLNAAGRVRTRAKVLRCVHRGSPCRLQRHGVARGDLLLGCGCRGFRGNGRHGQLGRRFLALAQRFRHRSADDVDERGQQ